MAHAAGTNHARVRDTRASPVAVVECFLNSIYLSGFRMEAPRVAVKAANVDRQPAAGPVERVLVGGSLKDRVLKVLRKLLERIGFGAGEIAFNELKAYLQLREVSIDEVDCLREVTGNVASIEKVDGELFWVFGWSGFVVNSDSNAELLFGFANDVTLEFRTPYGHAKLR